MTGTENDDETGSTPASIKTQETTFCTIIISPTVLSFNIYTPTFPTPLQAEIIYYNTYNTDLYRL